VAAIGKRRDEAAGAKGKRRESGIRRREVLDDGGKPSATPVSATPSPADPSDAGVARDAATIGALLERTARRLAHMPDTPLRRELHVVVERYRRALVDWANDMPTPVQRVILLDCARALHDRVVSRSKR
jgi:hypothetical protein